MSEAQTLPAKALGELARRRLTVDGARKLGRDTVRQWPNMGPVALAILFPDEEAARRRMLSMEEIDLVRQWYNALCDVSPRYLEAADHALGRKITDWSA